MSSRTSAEAKKFGRCVSRGVDGRLREANGRFVKGKEAVEGLTRGFAVGASRGAGILTNSLTQFARWARQHSRCFGDRRVVERIS